MSALSKAQLLSLANELGVGGVSPANNKDYIINKILDFQLTALPAPTGLSFTNGLAKWDSVAHSDGYKIKVYRNGTFIEGSDNNVIHALESDWGYLIVDSGTYTFEVKALAPTTEPDSLRYKDSEFVACNTPYVYTKPPSQLPPVTANWDTAVPGKATWSESMNATGYKVQLLKDTNAFGDPINITDHTTLEYDFTNAIVVEGTGTYTFYVVPLGDGVNFKDGAQSYSLKDYVYAP